MKENILLLSDVPPCKNYTGGLMISQMARLLLEEKHNVYSYCIMNPELQPEMWKDLENDIDIHFVDRPKEHIEEEKALKAYYDEINKKSNDLIKYVKAHKITKVWCPLQGEVLTLMLQNLFDKTKLPYVVQIWDPIEWWMKDNSFDDKRIKSTLKAHDNVLKKAQKVITTSVAMSHYFNKKLNIECTEVMPAVVKNMYLDYEKESDDKFIIALTGQIYAREEFDALLSALDKMKWKYDNKEIYFYYYGQWSESYINSEKHSEFRNRVINQGFFPQKDLLTNIAKVNLLYCPYFFSQDSSFKKVSELSFPSKLITYLSLKVPTLLHAPNYSSPYLFLEKESAVFLLDSLDVDKIEKKLKEIISTKKYDSMFKNANKIFDENFTFDIMKRNFLSALDIKYDKSKKLNILEVNNIDESGRRFNGYDLLQEINNHTKHRAKQIVTYKMTDNKNVAEFYETNDQLSLEYRTLKEEADVLGVHNQLSITSNILKNSDFYKNSDLVHFHLIHNTKLSLGSMIELMDSKPSVFTIHDPWVFTGRCVYPQECFKWKDGCNKCDRLDTLFPLKQDNCHSLWELKKKVFKQLDIDIIVSTPYMLDLVKTSPLTKHLSNIHLIPFGIDLKKFNTIMTKEEARKKLGIPKDDIVLFFRAQFAAKGTEFIIEAMEELETDKKITLLSCSEVGLLESLRDKYNVIDLGNIKDDKMITAYNACDIFLMPSRGESFGLMAIEAMACGRPIVVFNNTALPSVTFAPECGYLVDDKDSHKLMEAIDFLINNKKECEKRGKLGRKLAEENYDINTYHERLFKAYEEAYERQKNKKPISINREVNYELKDVQKLDEKLSYCYRKIMPRLSQPEFLHSNGRRYDKKYIIDYSNDSVQNLIYLFNEHLYEIESNIEKYPYEELPSFKTMLYLYKNDRPKLVSEVSYALRNKKILSKVVGFSYKAIRKIKHIIFFYKKNK